MLKLLPPVLLRSFYCLIVCLLGNLSFAADNLCHGQFLNPITDICWRCLFPMTLGSATLHGGDNPDTPNPQSPVCVCGAPMPRVGINVGFWEPVRLIDVTRQPYCFVNLGGKRLAIGSAAQAGAVDNQAPGEDRSFYHVHYYVYPVLYWLNLITDALCVENEGFDIAYLSELDPTWSDPELAFIVNPEAVLFANKGAQAACAADCVQATQALPNDKLFWCGGCQGSLYPFTGHVQAQAGSIQASVLVAERMLAKLHREGLVWGTAGDAGLSGRYPMPIISKSHYRYQMTYPIPTTTGCYPFGHSTALWGSEHAYPIAGEDFGYVIWRKRNCCAL